MAKRPAPSQQGLTRRQISRKEREERLQRMIMIGVIVIAVVVIGLVGYALLNENVIQPRRPVVTVNDDSVSVTEFQDRVLFDYFLQTGGQSLAQTGMDPTFFGQLSLDGLINELLIVQQADERGLTVSDAEVEEDMQLSFGYDAGEPEPTSTPRPTEAADDSTPTPTSTFVMTPTPSPTPTLEPGVTPTPTFTPSPTVTPSPTPSGPVTATPTLTPLPTSEPMTETEYEDQFSQFLDQMATATGLSAEQLRDLWAERTRVVLLQNKLLEDLDLQPEETKVMVHAAHILVDTEEEAQAVEDRLAAGESFEEVAAEVSTDTSAYRGGDLGWFGEGNMIPEFEQAAFALQPGEISEPVQSQYGWHIIKLYDRDDAVPLTEAEKEQSIQDQFTALLDQWRSEATVEIADDWESVLPELP